MTAVEAAATRRTKASFRIVLLLLSRVSTSCMSALIRSAGRTGSAARDDLDHVAVRELVLAPYALPVKACGRPPEPGASTLLLHLVMDCSRNVHDGHRWPQRDGITLPQEHAHEAGQPPHRVPEHIER